jgi:hypothetical protein
LNNFLNWFGDSTAVDAKGLPLVLYHGTDKDITAFEAGRESINSNSLGSSWITRRNGIFFTDNVAFAETFATLTKERRANGANILPVYLKMEQPLDFVKGLSQFDEDALAAAGYNTRMLHQAGTLPWELFDDEEGEALTAAMRKAGYDSAVFEEEDDNGEMQKAYVVLDPQQIKSASGNLGTFDPDTTSVLYQSAAFPTDKEWAQLTPEEQRAATAANTKDAEDRVRAAYGDSYVEGDYAPLYQSATGVGGFRAWAGTDNTVIEPDEINDVDFSKEGPFVLRAYHGTTHSFEAFNASLKGNVEGRFGAVNYFTTSESDAGDNYAGEGPDLTSRIERRAEQLQQ